MADSGPRLRNDELLARIALLERELSRAVADKQKAERIAQALQAVGASLSDAFDLDRLLTGMVDKVTIALDADRATLYLLDKDAGTLTSRIVQGEEVRTIFLRVGEGIAGEVARMGRTIRIADAYKDPRFNPAFDRSSGYRTRTILAVPLRTPMHKTVGVLQVLNKKRGKFTLADEAILSAVAAQAAVLLDNSRLFASFFDQHNQLLAASAALEERVRTLNLLFELERAMGHATQLEELCSAVLGEAMGVCDADVGAVALRSRDGTTGAIYQLARGESGIRKTPFPELRGLLGYAIRENSPTVSSNVSHDPRRLPPLDEDICDESSTALVMPLEGEPGTAMGALALYGKSHGVFTEDDVEICKLVAANTSTAIRLMLAQEGRMRDERLNTIGRLMSGVMHDLKTPMAVIGGYARLMQQADSPQKRADYAELILRQIEHMASMQREVLEFARGEKSLLIRKVYLQKFFQDVFVTLEPELSKRGVKLLLELEDKGTARFDEGKIVRVIHNLARNAAEAMGDSGGSFTIRVQRNDEGLILSFEDTGPGIPKELEANLFQSFVTSGKKGGTGLGLAIVKKIVEEHDGRISVSSTNHGVRFTLVLPQRQP